MLPCRSRGGSDSSPGFAESPAVVRAAGKLLADLPGIVAVRRVDERILSQVAAEERGYESRGILPLRNIGIETAQERQVVFALLKDKSFRNPPAPTVYMVEESEGAGVPAEQLIVAGPRTYRILGVEVLPGRGSYAEKIVSVGDSFVVFPERRASPQRPSYFLIPALGFAELEEAQDRLKIRNVFSISPSASADALLRELCGFPADPRMASLLVGFDCA
jgi:hypothetical protein